MLMMNFSEENTALSNSPNQETILDKILTLLKPFQVVSKPPAIFMPRWDEKNFEDKTTAPSIDGPNSVQTSFRVFYLCL